MEDRTNVGAGIAIAFFAILSLIINTDKSKIDYCKDLYPDVKEVGKFIDASKWIDKDLAPQLYKAISKLDGLNKDLTVVWHHSGGSSDVYARELCELTNDRFAMGCSYSISIHDNGNVIGMSNIDEYTASVKGLNSQVISVVFVGDYEKNIPPDIMLYRACQIKQAFQILDDSREDFNIGSYAYHGQLTPTLCAGKNLIKKLNDNGLITHNK